MNPGVKFLLVHCFDLYLDLSADSFCNAYCTPVCRTAGEQLGSSPVHFVSRYRQVATPTNFPHHILIQPPNKSELSWLGDLARQKRKA